MKHRLQTNSSQFLHSSKVYGIHKKIEKREKERKKPFGNQLFDSSDKREQLKRGEEGFEKHGGGIVYEKG